MIRIKLAMVIGGAVLAFFGLQEFRVSSGGSSEAVEVELASLERGKIPDGTHLKVGPHFALYAGLIYEYEYEESRRASADPRASDKVTLCYYPILSVEHPVIKAIANEEEDFEFTNIAMLVKTKRFKTVGRVPDDLMAEQASVQGLVINAVDSLDSEERRLLKESFPQVNFDTVLILEEGRQPSSIFKTMAMMLGGLALSIVGIGSFFIGAATK